MANKQGSSQPHCFWVWVLSQAIRTLKGTKSAAAAPLLWTRRVLASIWLQDAERGNACSHWHQHTRGQFSQHSAELAGKKCVLHSSVLLHSQMENPPLERWVNAVGIVWETSLRTTWDRWTAVRVHPRSHEQLFSQSSCCDASRDALP